MKMFAILEKEKPDKKYIRDLNWQPARLMTVQGTSLPL
jgi:hypothetical protein